MIQGNLLTAIPDEIGSLSNLEKLFLANNRIANLSMQLGKLRKLEEMSLTGNPLPEVPKSIGCCVSMEVRPFFFISIDPLCSDFRSQLLQPDFSSWRIHIHD